MSDGIHRVRGATPALRQVFRVQRLQILDHAAGNLVLIQRLDHGGGEVWFDNELLRKDGRSSTVMAMCCGSEPGWNVRRFDQCESW